MTSPSLIDDPQYQQGRIDALMQLILAVAGCTMTKEQFRQHGLQRLETMETVLLNAPVPEARRAAVEHVAEWLRHVTS